MQLATVKFATHTQLKAGGQFDVNSDQSHPGVDVLARVYPEFSVGEKKKTHIYKLLVIQLNLVFVFVVISHETSRGLLCFGCKHLPVSQFLSKTSQDLLVMTWTPFICVLYMGHFGHQPQGTAASHLVLHHS